MVDTLEYNNAPDYLRAADLHNTGAGTASFFSDPISWTQDAAGNVLDAVTKIPAFAITSVASGINSIYNSGVVAGNWLGVTDAQENDLQSTLSSFDSNLGDYYAEHKQLVDTAGFLVTSLIPGMAGTKLVNVGQRMLSGALKTGGVAKTFAQATGLIRTVTSDGKTLATVAGEALAYGGQQFTVMHAGVLKALASGVSQAALESAGFEAMVQATMFRSPLLENHEIKDIGHNILTAAALGGVIGGAFNAASTYGTIKKAIIAADAESAAARKLSSTANLTSESDKIIIRSGDIAEVPTNLDERLTRIAEKKITNARLDIRESINKLAKGDTELGNIVADTMETLPGNSVANAMSGVTGITRASGAKGDTLAYVRLHGTTGVGDITFDAVKSGELNLADKVVLRPGQTYKNAVDEVVSKFPFKADKPWNIVTSSGPEEIEARYIWAETKAAYKSGMLVDAHDIPVLEGAFRNKLETVTIRDSVGTYTINNLDDLANEVLQAKREVADELLKAKRAGWGFNAGAAPDKNVSTITSREIAKAVNVDVRALESEVGASMFARQDAQTLFNASREKAGLAAVDLNYVPTHAVVSVDPTRLAGVNVDLTSALVNSRMTQKVNRESVDRVFSSITGDMYDKFPAEFRSQISQANRTGAGAGVFSSANSDYNTIGSTVEYIGKSTADLTDKLKKTTLAHIESPAVKLRSNPAAAVEFSALNDMRNATSEFYVLNEAKDGLILRSLRDYNKAVKEGVEGVKYPTIQEGVKLEVKFKTPEAAEAVIAEIQANGSRIGNRNALLQSQGHPVALDPEVFYGWKPDENSMKHFAFVKDTTVSGQAAGHTSMIHAKDAETLTKMIEKIEGNPELSHLKVYTKRDTENFFKARGEYAFDRTLHENYIDSTLKSAGVNNNFFPKTDPNAIVDEWLANHSRRDSLFAKEVVTAKYADEFDELQRLGDQFTNVAASQKGVSVKNIESTVRNPYNDYRKTALNISRVDEYPLLSSMNRTLSKAVDGTIQNIIDAYKEVQTISDLPRINKLLEEAGISHAYKSAAEVIYANHTAPKPYLSNFIRGANSILATTFLKLDFLNPIVNSVSAQVLLGSETNSQVKKILRTEKAAGVVVPGTDDAILSPIKMIGKANSDWFKSTPELDEVFKHHGWTVKVRDIQKSILDDAALTGSETPAVLNSKLQSMLTKSKQISDFGAKITGNDLAEEYNRFVSAHVASQMADHQIAVGLMPLEGKNAYINTFVNRTQTNTLASQRPLLFQGPVGQAIGLFQSFQFNTMQQLFRGVAEGGPKDAAMLLGLQGTIFGLNGLPGFQYINQHIIGTASGNQNHTDAYSTIYGTAGKTVGDWLMYGIPSNLLQTNLYSRGDINPRSLTVIPVAPQDIVAVSAFSKFAGNLKETMGKIAGGGDVWESILQGLEHNAISRPLAGLAVTLQATTNPGAKAFSTTSAGNISFVNDFMSLATLSRLAGGKPLDEALANDEVSRSMAYKAADRERMKAATETFKTTVIGDPDGAVTPKAVDDYLTQYVRHGGQRENFNKEMLRVLTTVNTPRANQIIMSLKGPYAEHMKNLMHGPIETLETQ